MKTPRAYQLETFEKHKNDDIACINLDCGLGKTLVGALIAIFKKKPTLIIAPNLLCDVWYDELVEAGVDPEDIWIANKPEENKDPEGYEERFRQWLSR